MRRARLHLAAENRRETRGDRTARSIGALIRTARRDLRFSQGLDAPSGNEGDGGARNHEEEHRLRGCDERDCATSSRRASMPHPGMREMAAHATMKRNTACVGATSAIAPPAIGPMTIARLPVNVTSALIRLSSSRSAVKYAGNARGTVSAIPQVIPKTAANVTSALIRLSSSRSAVKYAGNARGTVSAIPQVIPKTAAPRNTPAMLVPTT